MKVVIIGSGNVAHVLGQIIAQNGHNIIQIAGRNKKKVDDLASLLHTSGINRFSDLSASADIYILAVSDTALTELRSWLPPIEKGIVVHTAGAVNILVLKEIAARYGVLYPLQSLKSGNADYPEIPFLTDADSSDTLSEIQLFASSLSTRVIAADDEVRLKLHTTAVVVNNFTNYLYSLAEEFCTQEGLDFSLLLPLLNETVKRLALYPARSMQTGPAIRNDRLTMDKHLSVLQSYSELTQIYQDFSLRIARFYENVS